MVVCLGAVSLLVARGRPLRARIVAWSLWVVFLMGSSLTVATDWGPSVERYSGWLGWFITRFCPMAVVLGVAVAELVAQYVQPPAGYEPGKLLLVSPALIGVTGAPPPSFVTNTLGFRATPDQPTFYIPSTKKGMPLKAGLPEMFFTGNISAGVGMAGADSSTTKYLYRMEYHRYINGRPSSRPFVAVRNPPASSGTFAQAVTVTVQLDYLSLIHI